MNDAPTTIAAFSINEHIRWATAKVIRNDIDLRSIRFGGEIRETMPGEIADQVADYLAGVSETHHDIKRAAAIGVSMIGPVDVEKQTVDRVLRKGWETKKPRSPVINFREVFSRETHNLFSKDKYLVVQNDATCAALAEWHFRKNPREDDGLWVYITINAGINCGIVSRPLFQYRHPEIGHNYPARHPADPFTPDASGCPAHIFCFEGMASGDSMQKRWGDDWGADERAWHLEAFYVGQICLSATLNFRPDKLILGGYVTRRNPDFLTMVRREFADLNKGYIRDSRIKDTETYIVAGQFDDKVNLLGALVLALYAIAPPNLSLLTKAARTPRSSP